MFCWEMQAYDFDYETIAETAKTHKIQRCQVLTLGTVAWSTQQKNLHRFRCGSS